MKSLQQLKAAPPGRNEWPALSQPCNERLGGEMKVIFGELTAGPIPDRMQQLVDALEEAFHRGELYAAGSTRRS